MEAVAEAEFQEQHFLGRKIVLRRYCKSIPKCMISFILVFLFYSVCMYTIMHIASLNFFLGDSVTHSFQTLPARDGDMQNPALILHEDPALDNDDGEPSVHSVSIGGLSFDTTRAMVRKAGLIDRYFVLFCIASGKA